MEKTITCEFVPRWGRNPYHNQLTKELEREGVMVGNGKSLKQLVEASHHGERRPDIIHLHATPPFGVTPADAGHYILFHARLKRLKEAGSRIVWTIHDVFPHESRWEKVDMLSGRALASRVDHCIVHSISALNTICQRWRVSSLPHVTVIPHGHYIDAYPNEITRQAARQRFGISDERMVYLFLGLMRPYKGLEFLLDAFVSMKDRSGALLFLAGEPVNSEIQRKIEGASNKDKRIRFFPGYVRDEELQNYMNAADAVVFPYRNSLTSGAVILAMGFAKSCIAPKLGAIQDVLDTEGAYLIEEASTEAVRSALERAYKERSKLSMMGMHNLSRCKQWSWDRIATQTALVYKQCLARSDC